MINLSFKLITFSNILWNTSGSILNIDPQPFIGIVIYDWFNPPNLTRIDVTSWDQQLESRNHHRKERNIRGSVHRFEIQWGKTNIDDTPK